jgi:hypothetical protein
MDRQSICKTIRLVIVVISCSMEEVQYEDLHEELEQIAEFVNASSDQKVKDAYLHMHKSMYAAKSLCDAIDEIQALHDMLSS